MLGLIGQPLGMPLYGDQQGKRRIFVCFDDAVGGGSDDAQTSADFGDALLVIGVDGDFIFADGLAAVGFVATAVACAFRPVALPFRAAAACGAPETLGVAAVFAGALAFAAVALVEDVFVAVVGAVAFEGAGLASFGSASVVAPFGRV